MSFKIARLGNTCSSILLLLFSQAALIVKGQDYFFITQPPSELECNPHSPEASLIRLECSVGVSSGSQLPVDTRIVWFKRTPNSDVGEQLCESDVATLMAVSPFTSGQTRLLRSIVELKASAKGDLVGEYWCQVVKGVNDNLARLSNRSTVLSIRGNKYYHEKGKANCEAGSIFLVINFPTQNLEFSSTSSVQLCSLENPNFTIIANPTESESTEEVDDSFILSRMWVYILVPVIATMLIFTFLLLFVALITTCIQKRESKKRHLSTIANVEVGTAIKSDTQVKSNGTTGNGTAVTNTRSGKQTPTPSDSVGKGSSAETALSKQLKNKQNFSQQQFHQQQLNQQQGEFKQCEDAEGEDPDSDDEDYFYTDVPAKKDREAVEVVGRLRGACTGSNSTCTETDPNCNDNGDLKYCSLDPEAMDPPHTYHAMQSKVTDGPQHTYSEPGAHLGRSRPNILANRHRPSPPVKVPPRLKRGNVKQPPTAHVPSRSSVDGEYIDPKINDRNSHLYQGLTPDKQEYLALYMTPDSSVHTNAS